MRVAAVDADSTVLNAYTGRHRVDQDVPELPWAVHLAGRDQRFWLLAFDLDAKTDPSPAHRDAGVLAGLLEEVGIAHVVCESGPSGGRHVWVALAGSVDADTAATLARLARHVCPTLDLAPLTNPVTGCVRPPGAPHRDGGHSTVLHGDLSTLTARTTTPEQVRALVSRLAQLVGDAVEPTAVVAPSTPLPVDQHGHLYLPGPRRALPPVSQHALHDQSTTGGTALGAGLGAGGGAVLGDASAGLWTVLIGAVSARWRHDDVAALVATAPGLEHLRSERDRGQRRARPAHGLSSPAAVLRRQWRKAVQHVATTARQVGSDPTFDARADAITAHVRDVQARADATAGRWSTGAGPGDRRVLDVLCVLALQALCADLEADNRRVALLAGIGRETARTALLRLARNGWITQTLPAHGPHGAHWALTPTTSSTSAASGTLAAPAVAAGANPPPVVIHRDVSMGRAQADPRPAGAGAAERFALLATLTARTQDAAHDVFTAGSGLGHHMGNVYARTTHQAATTLELARTLALTLQDLEDALQRLRAVDLVEHDRGRWRRRHAQVDDARAALDGLARARGVAGRLLDRSRRYRVERFSWAWWQAEQAWMTAPRRAHPTRRAGAGQLDLLPEFGTSVYGAYPRRADGRADYRAGRTAASAALDTGDQRWTAPTASLKAVRSPRQSRVA